ncbi:methyltransferase family protein [Pseudonocardia cypriaca]|uniref:Protein-S-isoprenylcysteine O-methyltransferase Ste14 n=1 Tax=Pseudonocardia cypriaca TaxID=882449 RepID=A0A543GG61_9PSEU|nr:isoprenylcysteine carboxylmethyltransferase family protein [Pseudonocardia cypriaca]TQM45051.1 protein-S-isoprenylcysteine O-methyltransferase Ste14 [Pseudonocardia cypriaca]
MSIDDEAARRRAAIGSALFMAAGPGMVTGFVPWLLTRWRPRRPVPGGVAARAAGAVLVGVGASVITHSFARFAKEGLGTPVPAAPPTELVVGGLYRHVRNPMYLALDCLIVGQALLLGRARLVAYATAVQAAAATFVKVYEEPTLARTFGDQYERYRRNVPGWWPRLRPWEGLGR